MRHIFLATKSKTEAYPQLIFELSEALHYIHDPNWFPRNFVNITEVPSLIIQKLSINHYNVEIENYNAENHFCACKILPKNTNTSLEASPIENIDTITNSQPIDTCINETTETDFSSTLLDDRTFFSSHIVNTLIDFDDNSENNNHNKNKNNNSVANDTTDNTNI